MLEYLFGLFDKLWYGVLYALIWLTVSFLISMWKYQGTALEAEKDHRNTPGRRP